jgi:hypothetical protein
MGLRDAENALAEGQRAAGSAIHEWGCATPQSESKGFARQERGPRMGLRDAA